MIGKLAGHLVGEQDCVWTAIPEPPAASSILVTMPHAGTYEESDLEGMFVHRDNGVDGKERFVWPFVRDMLISGQPIGVSFGVVRALLPRRYIDCNRALEGSPSNLRGVSSGIEKAVSDPQLVRFYRAYHDAVETWLRSFRRTNKEAPCLLLDVHGFRIQPDYAPPEGFDVILGTDYRKTVNKKIDVDRKLATFLREHGWQVFLPGDEPLVEGVPDWRSGQYTIKHYSQEFGVDAVQLEIARHLRIGSEEATEKGKRLSADLTEFLRQWFRK